MDAHVRFLHNGCVTEVVGCGTDDSAMTGSEQHFWAKAHGVQVGDVITHVDILSNGSESAQFEETLGKSKVERIIFGKMTAAKKGDVISKNMHKVSVDFTKLDFDEQIYLFQYVRPLRITLQRAALPGARKLQQYQHVLDAQEQHDNFSEHGGHENHSTVTTPGAGTTGGFSAFFGQVEENLHAYSNNNDFAFQQ